MDGIVVCDKPAGPTSHDVVARIRRLAGQRRVGHAGTLDPPATGVLVVALGRATRLLPFLPAEPKRYVTEVVFGVATDTLDATGAEIGTAAADHLDEASITAALEGFLGPQAQVPPMVSAIKIGGERLYAKARRGEEVPRPPRHVVIHALELLRFRAGQPPVAELAVSCSGGTYVRSLAADLAVALGTVGHVRVLRRTAVGPFGIERAHALDRLDALAGAGRLAEAVLSPAEAMTGTAVRRLSPGEADALAVGKALEATGVACPVAAIAPDGRLVAVVQDVGGQARSRLVLG